MAQKWPKIAKMALILPKMAQILAPAKKNSRDISPVSPTFSISDLDMIVVQLKMMMMGWTPLDSGKPNYPEEECRIDKNKEQFILCFHYTQSFLCGLKGEGTFSRSNKSESVVLATIWVNWIQHIFGQKDNCNMVHLLLWIFCQLFKKYIFEAKTKERKHNNEKVAFRSLIIVEWYDIMVILSWEYFFTNCRY